MNNGNMKMQRHPLLIGLLSIVLLIHCGSADISLTLRNANYEHGNAASTQQTYIPPPVQDVPISEEYNNDNNDNNNESQSDFKESNFGDSKYQIFEVHNHYEPGSAPVPEQSQQHTAETSRQSNYQSPGYLPPQTQQIHIQHLSSSNSLDDELDLSFVGYAAAAGVGANPPPHVQQQFSAGGSSQQAAVPFPSNYNHDASRQQILQQNGRRAKQLEEGVLKSVAGYAQSHQQIRIENLHVNRQQNGGNGGGSYQQVQEQGAGYIPPTQSVSHSQARVVHPTEAPQVYNSPADYSAPASDYSPPSEQNGYRAPEYRPPTPSHPSNAYSAPQQAGPSNAYSAPEYLPPTQGGHSNVHSSPVGGAPSNAYSAPEYLPPEQAAPSNAYGAPIQAGPSNAYHAPEYLPPTQGSYSHAQSAPISSGATNAYSAPEYLPPSQGGQSHAHGAQAPVADAYRAPEYLPPTQGGHSHVHSAPISSGPSNAYSAPEYLPPTQGGHSNAHSTPATGAPSNAYSAPEYLPPTPAGPSNIYSAPEYLPPAQQYSSPGQSQVSQHPLPQPAPQLAGVPPPTQSSSSLPDGYEFNRPENAEQAIAELHSLQLQQQQQQHQQQLQAHHEQHVPAPEVIYGQVPQQQTQAPINNGYLPPSSSNQHAPAPHSYQVQQGNVQQYSAPGYLPPTHSTVSTGAQLHSLSSYMASVQPFARYGAERYSEPRKPFAEYGPPPGSHQQAQHFQPSPAVEVAPMYREPAARPQHYAPAMSYRTANAEIYRSREILSQTFRSQQNFQQQHHQQQAGGYSLNAQAKQTLQRLMPKEIHFASQHQHQQQQQVYQQPQHHQQTHYNAPPAQAPATAYAAVPTAALPAAGKIRTVQIINPHTGVKTLKILETSDHSGVKTIKILGTSNEQPNGQHRVVKVVSKNAHDAQESHVQTVKIFEDVESGAGANNNAYLPPRKTRDAKENKRSVPAKEEKNKKRSSTRTSKQRRNSGRRHHRSRF